jgi:hypothetical protein
VPDEPKVDGIDKRELAAQYGWALSVLKSNPELWKIFNKAVKQTWSPQRFIAEVRGTDWFRTTSEARRNYQVLRDTDPATFEARVNQTRALVRDAVVAMGAQYSEKEITRLANNVLKFGWNDAQIRDTIAGSVKEGAQGTYGGEAAANAEQLRQVALLNGVQLSDKTLRNWLVRIAAGEGIEGFEAYVKQMAAEAYPQYADRLNAGEDLDDIVSPYKETMARVLEINPEELDLFDPTLRKSFQATDPTTGQPTTKPLWQFERELKQDTRWQTTNNARDELMGHAQKILRDFGLVS